MRSAAVLGAIALIGCSRQGSTDGSIDINAAAARGQSDIDRYASSGAVATPSPLPRRSPRPAPAPLPSPTAEPIGLETDQETEGGGAAAATDVVRRYFAAISAGRYRKAAAMREGDGGTAAVSARTFDDYATYDATVGAAGRIDSGAGQRHVTVPVTVRATTKAGRDLELPGTVTLHRVADGIETDDPTAHRWRITALDIAPADGRP